MGKLVLKYGENEGLSTQLFHRVPVCINIVALICGVLRTRSPLKGHCPELLCVLYPVTDEPPVHVIGFFGTIPSTNCLRQTHFPCFRFPALHCVTRISR